MNRDYQDEVRNFGDSVRINSIGIPTVGSYTTNTWNLTPEVLQGAGQTLQLTQQDYFYFGVDDVDMAQNKPKVMNYSMYQAGWALAQSTDTFLADTLVASVQTANQLNGGSNLTVGTGPGEADAFTQLVTFKQVLDAANVPDIDRFVVVPPWFLRMLLLDVRFTSFGTAANLSTAVQGVIKELVGFDIRWSNNVPTSGSAYKIVAGYRGAATYAESIPDGQPEAFRYQGGFTDVVRGLHVYGATVVQPNGLALLNAVEGT